jgi:hypothetical protein
MDDWTPARPGEKWTNRVLERARRLYRLSLGTGLVQTYTPAGRSLWRDPPESSFYGRLVSGTSGGPYNFRRVAGALDGTWKDYADRDDKAVAYQANLQTVPVPSVVLLRDVGLGDEYRFWTPRYGAMVEDCTGSGITVTVHGCAGALLPGATVTVSLGGVTQGTCTTDASGVCNVPLTAAGTYTVSISAYCFTTQENTVTVVCGVGATLSVTLTPLADCLCPDSSLPCCTSILPRNPTLSTPTGEVVLTYTNPPDSTFDGWDGCINVNCDVAVNGNCSSISPGTTVVRFHVFCVSDSSGTNFYLQIAHPQCGGGSGTPAYRGYPTVGTCDPAAGVPDLSFYASGPSKIADAGWSCSPVNITWNINVVAFGAFNFYGRLYPVYGSGTKTFTLTI